MIEQNDDEKFREFLERHSRVPADVLQMQLSDYLRQSISMKNVIQELIERASEKEDINAEYQAVGCLLGWIDEASVLRVVVESHQQIEEADICKLTHLPKRMVRSILNKLIDEGSVCRNTIRFSND